MRARVWTGIACSALLVLACLTYLAVHTGERPEATLRIVLFALAMWIVFVIGAVAVMRSPQRVAAGLILAGAVGLQLVAMTAPPQTSTDYYRYAWDGRVQAAGLNPYSYVPADPALIPLRDDWLFPPGRECPASEVSNEGVRPPCPLINRPIINTIYPPVAELYYRAIEMASPSGSKSLPVQIAAGLMGIGVTITLLLLGRRRNFDPRRAVLWAWCPLVILELGNNAHVDGVASLLVVVGLGILTVPTSLSRWRAIAGGLALGAAVAAKLLPVMILPSVVKRRPIAVLCAAVFAVVAVYLPHVLTIGSGAAGSLGGYADEEEEMRFAVIKLLLPEDLRSTWALPIGLVALFAAALWALLRSDPLRPWLTAAATVGISFIVITPAFQWYALLLVPLVVMGARAVWLLLPAAMMLVYLEPELKWNFPPTRAVAYLIVAVIVAGSALADYVHQELQAESGHDQAGTEGPPLDLTAPREAANR